MTDTLIAPVVTGFYSKPRTRRVSCDWLEPADGAERLWADVRSDIPIGVTDEIPFGVQHTHREGWEAVAPWVTDWNALAWDTASRSMQPVPAPAVGGPEVFKYLDPIIVEWLAFTLRTTYLNLVSDDEKKASVGSANNPSAPDSASSSPEIASQPNHAD
jgi:hypothetical protein